MPRPDNQARDRTGDRSAGRSPAGPAARGPGPGKSKVDKRGVSASRVKGSGAKPGRLPGASRETVATAAERRRALRLMAALEGHYPEAACELEYRTPHELLVATILSAQATDVSVNKATPALFARFPTPSSYASSSVAEIEPYIRTIGLFRSKARAIHESMSRVSSVFGGKVPETMEELLTLRGVARKTANVVLGNAFGRNEGFVVDTHIDRLSKRFGLARPGAGVGEVERRLMALFPRESWCQLSHRFIWHGRRACRARGCDCSHPVCAVFGPCGTDGRAGSSCEGCAGGKPRSTLDGTGVFKGPNRRNKVALGVRIV
ncbi:MAG: endonuclease III [Phycisphaeraceae bacterium]|nr:endonuclease III [Phycisphaeraceae bacterium]